MADMVVGLTIFQAGRLSPLVSRRGGEMLEVFRQFVIVSFVALVSHTVCNVGKLLWQF